jgi:para-nitrobenzyl esterase
VRIASGSLSFGMRDGETQKIAPTDPAALVKLRDVPAGEVLGTIKLGTVMGPRPRSCSSPFADGKVAIDAGAPYRTGAFAHLPLMVARGAAIATAATE